MLLCRSVLFELKSNMTDGAGTESAHVFERFPYGVRPRWFWLQYKHLLKAVLLLAFAMGLSDALIKILFIEVLWKFCIERVGAFERSLLPPYLVLQAARNGNAPSRMLIPCFC